MKRKSFREKAAQQIYPSTLTAVPVLAEPPKKRIEVALKSCQKQTGLGGEARDEHTKPHAIVGTSRGGSKPL